MVKIWTEKTLKDALKRLTVVVDTREQQNAHITEFFDKKDIEYTPRKLDIGDYACQIDDGTFERSFVVERKHNLDELCANLTADRNRFEREFLRAKAFGTKVFLVIEEASWEDVYLQNYRSKLSSKALLASLFAWQTRFNVTILFCKKSNTPQLIYGLLYYSAREELLGKAVD